MPARWSSESPAVQLLVLYFIDVENSENTRQPGDKLSTHHQTAESHKCRSLAAERSREKDAYALLNTYGATVTVRPPLGTKKRHSFRLKKSPIKVSEVDEAGIVDIGRTLQKVPFRANVTVRR